MFGWLNHCHIEVVFYYGRRRYDCYCRRLSGCAVPMKRTLPILWVVKFGWMFWVYNLPHHFQIQQFHHDISRQKRLGTAQWLAHNVPKFLSNTAIFLDVLQVLLNTCFICYSLKRQCLNMIRLNFCIAALSRNHPNQELHTCTYKSIQDKKLNSFWVNSIQLSLPIQNMWALKNAPSFELEFWAFFYRTYLSRFCAFHLREIQLFAAVSHCSNATVQWLMCTVNIKFLLSTQSSDMSMNISCVIHRDVTFADNCSIYRTYRPYFNLHIKLIKWSF